MKRVEESKEFDFKATWDAFHKALLDHEIPHIMFALIGQRDEEKLASAGYSSGFATIMDLLRNGLLEYFSKGGAPTLKIGAHILLAIASEANELAEEEINNEEIGEELL